MFEQHFSLKENPFAAGHQPRFIYPSREHQEAIAHLRYGVENREPFVLITGEVGTGKTTAIFNALDQLGQRASVALITNSALTRVELLEEICLRFGMKVEGTPSKPQLLSQLEQHLDAVHRRNDRSVLIVDEAQNLGRELLEEIRLLSNLESQGDTLMQIFLVGQPELETRMAQPELRQLRQRIAVRYRLRPLDADETEHYIHHRISVAGGNAWQIFPGPACHLVHELSHGVPREINMVAGQALLNAFVEDAPRVESRHVSQVATELSFESVVAPEVAARAPAAAATMAAEPAEVAPPAAEPPHEPEPAAEVPEEAAPAPEPEPQQEPAVTEAAAEPPAGVLESSQETTAFEYESLPEQPGAAPEEPDLAEVVEELAPAADESRGEEFAVEPFYDPRQDTSSAVPSLAEAELAAEQAPGEEEPAAAEAEPKPAEGEPAPAHAGMAAGPPKAAGAREPAAGTPPAHVEPRPPRLPTPAALASERHVPAVREPFKPPTPQRKPASADPLLTLRAELEGRLKAMQALGPKEEEPAAPPPAVGAREAQKRPAPAKAERTPAPAATREPAPVVEASSHLPDRLRARLEATSRGGAEREKSRGLGQMLVWAAVIVVLVVLATLGWYQLRERPAAAPQRDATTAAQSSAPTQPAEPSPRPPEAAAPPQATPAVAAPVVAAPPVDTTPAPARTARRLYAVQVAAVRSQAQANAIEARLSRRTRMEGRVLHDAGKPWYRVVLGEYDNMDVASRAADSLVRADVVDMGVAVALPPSAPSQPR